MRTSARMAIVAGPVLALSLVGCAGPAPGSRSPESAQPVSAPPGSAPSTPELGAGDWPTYHGDAARTGVSRTMRPPTRTPRVRVAVRLDGAVYASPIAVGRLTVVATENDSVYGLDAAGRQVWRTRLGRPARRSALPCGNIDPLGITGTPVYDASTRSVLVAAEHGAPVRHELVSLDLATGHLRWRKGIDLRGVEASAMQQRGALALAGGHVWVPMGGLAGDCGGYKGRVIGVALSGRGTPVAFTVPTSREGGIWTPPGPSVDAAGHLFVAVGNGESVAADRYDHSDSIVKLAGTRLVDSFSPRTWAADNAADLDLGSQGPALVGTSWVFAAGKSGTAYVLRQGRLGGIGGEVSRARICRSFGGTGVNGNVVYVPCTDRVRAVRIRGNGSMKVLWRAPTSVSGSPVVGGGRVWALDTDAGVLHALDPATGRSRSAVRVGAVTRFATPALHGADVLVPTKTGLVVVRTG